MIRKEELYINSSYVDFTLNMKPSVFCALFQDIAGRNSEDIGTGKNVTTDKGLDWIITRATIEFLNPVIYGDNLYLYTFPAETKSGFIFVRNGGITSLDGTHLIKVSSFWNILDNKKRKLVLHPNLVDVRDYVDEHFDYPERVIREENIKLKYSKKIKYSDCDLNGHLNNTKYIDMISDINDYEFYKKYRLGKISINFLAEVHEDDILDIYINDDETYIEGKVNDKSSFVAKVTYVPRYC